jgi:sugar/nucleoside kinase (ribokinase family)
MESRPVLRYIIAGQVRRDYIITPGGKIILDSPGGNLLYSASGLGVWDNGIGLIGKVGVNFPGDYLKQISVQGFDIRGIKTIEQEIDLRSFVAFSPDNRIEVDNPFSHFKRMGVPFPKDLLGYNPQVLFPGLSSELSSISVGSLDIPEDYWDATAVHICPMDYLSQSILISKFHNSNFHSVTLEVCPDYMTRSFTDNLKRIIKDTTTFFASEEALGNLFYGRTTNLWEMAEEVAGYGCEFVIIKRGLSGQYIYENNSRKRWSVPAYPSRVVDPTGAGNAFCGGYLYGYRASYDPVEATLHGNISASLAVEGSGSFYAMNGLPGFAHARLETLRGNVERV